MSEQLATKNDLRSFIAGDTFKQQVALSLPHHMTPDRFARVALTAMTRTPKLMDCTRESLLRCLMDCSSLGLEPDGRHAHLIPYKDACTLIVDWKGLVALARRSGDVAIFRAELVKERDSFAWENSIVTHGIDWRNDRGATQAVYSYVKFKDGSEDWEVMTLAEVEAIRKRSRSGNAGPWVTDFDEMAKKTAIRRHSKRLTLSPEFADALEKDGDIIEERNVTPIAQTNLAALLAAPAAQPVSDTPDELVMDHLNIFGASVTEYGEAIRRLKLSTATQWKDISNGEHMTALIRWEEVEAELRAIQDGN